MNKPIHWREVANLFANGMFRVKIFGKVYEINGIDNSVNMFGTKTVNGDIGFDFVAYGACTLMARSIDSLTEEELARIIFRVTETKKEELIKEVRERREYYINVIKIKQEFSRGIKLLSIGVLPPTISPEDVEFRRGKND